CSPHLLPTLTVTLRWPREARPSKGHGGCHAHVRCAASADHPSRLVSLAPQDDGTKWGYIFLPRERKRPITNSVAASMARPVMPPLATASAACSGTSSTRLSARHTFRVPIACPSCTGARTGPL